MVAYLNDNAKKEHVDSLLNYIKSQPYTRFVEYVDKETAKKRFIAQGERDFSNILEENPLKASLEFNLKSNYVNKDNHTMFFT